jgi:peptide/nickel transport system substrate-binding protein
VGRNSRRLSVAVVALAVSGLAVLGTATARTQMKAKYGGTLVVGVSAGEPDTLDPATSRGAAATEIYTSICQELYDSGSQLQTVPVLAAALPVLSKDKLSYTIRLRQGVLFNDGTPFNAAAVVTSVQRLMAAGSSRAGDFSAVAAVVASGPYTVVYRLKVRNSTFTGNAYVMSPTQLAKLGADFGTDPVCVGPFMFDHRVAGDNVTVIKSPYYYDKGNVFLDKIVFKPEPDAGAAVAALQAGDLQVLDNVSATALPTLQQASSLRVIQSPQLGWKGIQINIGNRNGVGRLPYAPVGTPLSSSPKLRQAFEEAIDRNVIKKVVYAGLGQPSCTLIAPADTPWFDATKVPCTPYDPADAKKLVAASGFSSPTVHLLTKDRTDDRLLAQFIQAQEAAVGINVIVDVYDNATAVAQAAAGNFDAYLSGFSPGGVDPNVNISEQLSTSGSRNVSGYSNPRLDFVLANGLKATSTKSRSTLYHVAQQIIAADRPIIPLYSGVTSAAFSSGVVGLTLSPLGALDLTSARFT